MSGVNLNQDLVTCLTFLSEPNSMMSEGLNRAGKFGVTLYFPPSLLVIKNNISKKIQTLDQIISQDSRDKDKQSSIGLLGEIGPVFASKIHHEESSIFVDHTRMHLRYLYQIFWQKLYVPSLTTSLWSYSGKLLDTKFLYNIPEGKGSQCAFQENLGLVHFCNHKEFHKLRTLHLVYLQDTDEDILFHTQQCKAVPHLWLDVMFQKRYTRCHVEWDTTWQNIYKIRPSS